MGGFNLPPGCNVSDIPGNRHSELEAEARWDSYYEKFPWLSQLSNEELELPGMTLGNQASLHDMIVDLIDHVYFEAIGVGRRIEKDWQADQKLAALEEAQQLAWEEEQRNWKAPK